MIDASLRQDLRALVGRQVRYGGGRCQVIEVLDEEAALVLQCLGIDASDIQGDQFGEARRRVPRCHTLPLFDTDGALHPDIAGWLAQPPS